MKYFIPTYDQALEITQKNECFTMRIREHNGVKISIFDYLLAQYQDFKKPIEDKDYEAFELRGLCFVHSPDGTKRRFLSMMKFFNVNQVEETQEHLLEKMSLFRVMDKMDGSIMRFVQFPNKDIVVKSKTFFDNDQTKMANDVYERQENLKGFVKETIEQGLAAFFELTGPNNTIVLKYPKTELTLLQIRNEETGEFLDIYSHPLVKKYNIKCTEEEKFFSLKEIMTLRETIENKEGWIGFFKNQEGQVLLAKVKSLWYIAKHGLYDKCSNEDFLMEKILDNTIDDVISELDVQDPRRPAIESITQATNHYVVHKMNEAKEIAKKFNGNRKEWAKSCSNEPFFFLAAKVVGKDLESEEEFMIKQIQSYIRGETNRLEKARKFISQELKCKLMMQFQIEDDS
jgi:T4 RnlA family RNA ligase